MSSDDDLNDEPTPTPTPRPSPIRYGGYYFQRPQHNPHGLVNQAPDEIEDFHRAETSEELIQSFETLAHRVANRLRQNLTQNNRTDNLVLPQTPLLRISVIVNNLLNNLDTLTYDDIRTQLETIQSIIND
jgi:hypothetical protein